MNANKETNQFPLEGGVYTDSGDGPKRVTKPAAPMPGKSELAAKTAKVAEKVEVAKADATPKPR